MTEEIVESVEPVALNVEFQAVVAEAKADYELLDTLEGRPRRGGSVTVYLDEVTGDQHQALSQKLANRNDKAGLLKRIAQLCVETNLPDVALMLEELSEESLTPEDRAYVTETEVALAALVVKLNATALTFNLTALHTIVVKDTRRTTRAALKITEKGIPEDRQEEYDDYFFALILTKACTSFVDHGKGVTRPGIGIDEALALSKFLPAPEFNKLSTKFADVLYKNNISEAVTNSADF